MFTDFGKGGIKGPRSLHTERDVKYFRYGDLRPRRGVDGGRVRPQRVSKAEKEILDIVEENPRKFVQQVPEVSHATERHILHEAQQYPYHVQKVQASLPTDHSLRLIFWPPMNLFLLVMI